MIACSSRSKRSELEIIEGAMKNLAKSFLVWSGAAVVSVHCATIRMQGKLTDASGAALNGRVFIADAGSNFSTWSGFVTLDSDGGFDVSYEAGSSWNVSLEYFPPGIDLSNFVTMIRYQLFTIDKEANKLTIYNEFNNYTLPAENNGTWCGLEIKVLTPGAPSVANIVDWDGSRGWCPDDYGKLNTIYSVTYNSGNLISNGSFENNYAPSLDYERWDSHPASGSFTWFDVPLGALRPYSGKAAAAVQYTAPNTTNSQGGNEYSFLKSDPFPVKPNTDYTVVFRYSAKNPVNWGTAGARPMVRAFSDFGLTEVNDLSLGKYGTSAYAQSINTWTPYVHRFKTGSSDLFARLDLIETSTLGTGGTFYFDDVQVLEGDYSAASLSADAFVGSNSLTYANGRNKVIQTRRSAANAYIYSGAEYDEFGRPVKAVVPVFFDDAADQPFSGTASPINGYVPQLEDYASSYRQNDGGFSYSETAYETSPLGRVVEASAPGATWKLGGGHTQTVFRSATASLDPDGDQPAPPADNGAKFSYEMSSDEDGHKVRAFQDGLGRVVRSSVKLGNRWINTGFSYDGNGNVLQKVAPPYATGQYSVVTRYGYDAMGNKLMESNPDYGIIFYFYDKSNRLRFAQTSEQAFGSPSRFSYVKYDLFDRVVEKGEYLDPAGTAFTQGNADNTAFPAPTDQNRKALTYNFYDAVPDNRNYCADLTKNWSIVIRSDASGNKPDEFSDWGSAYSAVSDRLSHMASFSGTVRFYQVFENQSQLISQPVSSFPPFSLSNPSLKVGYGLTAVLRGTPLFDQVAGGVLPFMVNWGPLSGRLVKTQACNEDLSGIGLGTEITKIFNYDKYGNIVDEYEYDGLVNDASKRWQRTSKSFDLLNRAKEKAVYAAGTDAAPQMTFMYSYDNEGHMTHETMRDNAGIVTEVAQTTYNDAGQVHSEKVGPDSRFMNTLYDYNPRGWVKDISAAWKADTTIFHQALKYENGSTPEYSGNVSEYDYSYNDGVLKRLKYQYDDMSRLTGVTHILNPNGTSTQTNWQYSYWDNGSINQVLKQGQWFTYAYNRMLDNTRLNQLDHVDFTGSVVRHTNTTNNFQYDDDGRMTDDQSRSNLKVYYSSNDRPYVFDYMTGADSYSQYMAYDESGNRRAKLIYKNNAFLSSTHYFDNGVEIREAVGFEPTQIFSYDGYGRMVPVTGVVDPHFPRGIEITMKNHLSSTVAMRSVDNVETYKTDYEPYGKLWNEVVNSGFSQTEKFTSKEHDEGIELDYFGARYYDADLSVWISPDPVRQYHSPYTYCGGDPTNCVDKDGRDGGPPTGIPNPLAYFGEGLGRSSGAAAKGLPAYTAKKSVEFVTDPLIIGTFAPLAIAEGGVALAPVVVRGAWYLLLAQTEIEALPPAAKFAIGAAAVYASSKIPTTDDVGPQTIVKTVIDLTIGKWTGTYGQFGGEVMKDTQAAQK